MFFQNNFIISILCDKLFYFSFKKFKNRQMSTKNEFSQIFDLLFENTILQINNIFNDDSFIMFFYKYFLLLLFILSFLLSHSFITILK